MKLFFEDWGLRPDYSTLPQQYDNLSEVLLVSGELPAGWTWELLVRAGDNLDIVTLSAMGGGVGVALTRELLSLCGAYQLQLRGTRGDAVRHSSITSVVIPGSMSGDAQWPTLPTEFSQAEARILAAAGARLPSGGTAGQLLVKSSGIDYEAGWASPATAAEADNTLPITSAAVHTQLGNIEVLLAAL